ncbi:MAG: 30S ribosomal protein S20 [Bacteroidales bacterium]|jgi:small subunit ribosomal protein S20|nr:30S ribosomal protein S20 [Bacteroidales bacterium]MDI9576085.1 30S ribosomal protein S20 [Bacteroidota bacterium]MDD2592732.1 30S ribosomal protein S20 [Bacteroidales bacterium]MDD3754965.1 30S ribosomal protein S20 [Bacteroidales bacterium]MDY0401522.1 30S ribosomal protein S20 [Bacteroidales bacterium]
MAHHKSAKKRIRSNEKKRLYNRYYNKTMRTMVKKFYATADPQEAAQMLPSLYSIIDKNVKRGIIHKNKGANLKHKITKELNKRLNSAATTA